MKKGVLIFLIVFTVFSFTEFIFASTPGDINSCQIIDTPGNYTLTRNLNGSDFNLTGCFNITSSNVLLDCNNYYLKNTTLISTPVIYAENIYNVSVQNCNISTYILSYGSGIEFLNVTNSTIKNNTIHSNSYGVYLSSSSNNLILGNNFKLNYYEGVWISLDSDNNQIINNTANSSLYGVFIYTSSNNTLKGNNFFNSSYNFAISGESFSHFNHNIDLSNSINYYSKIYYNISVNNFVFDMASSPNASSVYCINCSNITARNINLSRNYYGLFMFNSTNSSIYNLTVNSNYYGISILYGSNNLITNNSINFCSSDSGISLSHVSNNTLYNNTLKMNGVGISFDSSSNNYVFKNNVSNSSVGGIYLSSSDNNTLLNNLIKNSLNSGISLSSSMYNNLSNNNASSNTNGISISESSMNRLINNTANSNKYGAMLSASGISLYLSYDNVLINNTAMFNTNGIYLTESSNNTISNLVSFDSDRDGIHFSNSFSNNLFYSNSSSSGYYGIYMNSNSNKNNFTGNIITDNYYEGVYLDSSYNNTFFGNRVNSNYMGFLFSYSSDNNSIINNSINSNDGSGILLSSSSGNYVSNNTLNLNDYGFYLESDSLQNNFLNNSIWNCTSTDYGCIYISGANNNTFSGDKINVSATNLIYLKATNNTRFEDLTLTGAVKNDTYLVANYLGEVSFNNIFVNTSYNQSKEYVESGSQLLRKWYLDVINFNDEADELAQVSINSYDFFGFLQTSSQTDVYGVTQQELIEYSNNGDSESGINRTYYSNYTINSTKSGYNSSISLLNMSTNQNITFYLSDINPPLVDLTSPFDGTTYSGTSYNVTITFDTIDYESPIINCSIYVNDTSYSNISVITTDTKNNFYINLSSGTYSAYVNCTDSHLNMGNSSTNDFIISPPVTRNEDNESTNTGGGGGGGGSSKVSNDSFWQATRDFSGTDLSSDFFKEIASKERVKLSLNLNGKSETHYLGVSKTEKTYVIINVSSIPQSAKLYVGNEERFDLDLDGKTYDLYVKLNSILNNRANLTIKQINEPIILPNSSTIESSFNSTTDKKSEEENPVQYNYNILIIFIALIFAVILIVIILLIYFKQVKYRMIKNSYKK